ncbi:MAG: ATP-grasp domain-containing protein [Pseudomonadota bacterium]
MTKLFEYKSKELLSQNKIKIPFGKIAKSVDDATSIYEELQGTVMIKGQAFVTGRADKGAIKKASSKDEVKKYVLEMLKLKLGGFAVDNILIEKCEDIQNEMFAGVIIDDSNKCPVLIFSKKGGTGIEEIAKEFPDSIIKHPINIKDGLEGYTIRNLLRKIEITGNLQTKLALFLLNLYKVFRKYDLRSIEVNPIGWTKDENVVALDCHATVDDYAVFRHPELNIDFARELDHAPTSLEKIAYKIEKDDFRGTFFFIQTEIQRSKGEKYLGFHGAGGGGSMMAMDAILNEGYKVVNFCDTSGNPPASKVYRAAKIILSQPGIIGYFGSGSGVASQEQFHSARGLVKAFNEDKIKIPVVIRLGGNSEEQAINILENYTKDLNIPIKCYGKDTPVQECAEVLDNLIKENWNKLKSLHEEPSLNHISKAEDKMEKINASYSFKTVTNGTISFDYDKCKTCDSKVCIESCVSKILELNKNVPALNISFEDAKKGKCSECLACEVECQYGGGNEGCRIMLPIEGLDKERN